MLLYLNPPQVVHCPMSSNSKMCLEAWICARVRLKGTTAPSEPDELKPQLVGFRLERIHPLEGVLVRFPFLSRTSISRV